MEAFDFDKIVERRGSGSYKYDTATNPDTIPMWVADMDFPTAPCIIEALRRRVEHGIFGYTYVFPSYYDSVINWFGHRHGWNIEREWIQYTTGVVPAMSAVIKALTKPGDEVLLMSPVYNLFFTSVRNNGCHVVDVPLRRIDSADGFTYNIDFHGLEQACARREVKALLFCSPHNPAGRVWRRDELEQVYAICRAYEVIIISDEIHCELVQPDTTFIPFATIAADAATYIVTCNSPSKSFNIAGLQIANIITANKEWQQRIDRAINDNEVCDVNVFAPLAVEAAYSHEGEEWLCKLNTYIAGNYQALRTFFSEYLPYVPLARLEGTYLVWADVTNILRNRSTKADDSPMSASDLEDELMNDWHVWVNAGEMYGTEGYIRINIAMPRARLMEGLRRLAKGLNSI